ncbi:hypothetical protein Dda_6490 [Drechslerella dactyloides]|uniref:Uncharacterized protein n=1 Tax=Drechslerella dactyloides TaxID=74499 RepID=A0AAD6ITP1_DREDA|nr:hypothetical protein Dda_6490 [Drechslerella dactyloides]
MHQSDALIVHDPRKASPQDAHLFARLAADLTSAAIAAAAVTPESNMLTRRDLCSTNILLTLVKDRNFARMFGTGVSRAVPLPTYALFCSRDSLTILFSFNVPPMISKAIPDGVGGVSSLSIAQIVAPAGCQMLSTPLHLLGLDLYNRSGRLGMKKRMQAVSVNYLKSSLARIGRIVPAFGVGGVLNSKCRYHMMRSIEERMKNERAILG